MPQNTSGIHLAQPRESVQVHLPDGRVFQGAPDTPLATFFKKAFPDMANPPVAAIINGSLSELTWPVVHDMDTIPVFLSDSDGMRIYCRSLSFLLIVAAYKLFPRAQLLIDYSVPHGGYFCQIERGRQLSSVQLSKIEKLMQKMVKEDEPIIRERLSVGKAKEVFASRQELHKVQLLEGFKEKHIPIYSLCGFRDYFYGYMVPSTGYLQTFTLEPFSTGFILRFPRRENPGKLLPPQRFTVLRNVFNEYGKWLNLLGVADVNSLNKAIDSGRIEQVILVSEALHEKRIAEIAGVIARRQKEQHHLVFIAGPSSSGKTTFSKRLSIQLLAQGCRPYALQMDDYFLSRDQMIKGKDNEFDFDSINALDVPFFKQQLSALLAGNKVDLPRYDFYTGTREPGPTVTLEPASVLLVEGIHCLNPCLAEDLTEGDALRIFVSAITQLNLDRHNRVSTTDTRLIRRIVRDAASRGYTAEETIGLWENVRQGEKQNIFPYQEQAEIMFNSALAYELAVLKPLVEPLLLQVENMRARIETERLLAFLRWFKPYTASIIPSNSILREFIGGSSLDASTRTS